MLIILSVSLKSASRKLISFFFNVKCQLFPFVIDAMSLSIMKHEQYFKQTKNNSKFLENVNKCDNENERNGTKGKGHVINKHGVWTRIDV